MTENKRIFNVHEKKFPELENIQANTTHVGQLALSLQNQSKNTFPNSTEINPKDLTQTAMRGSDELQGSKKM